MQTLTDTIVVKQNIYLLLKIIKGNQCHNTITLHDISRTHLIWFCHR